MSSSQTPENISNTANIQPMDDILLFEDPQTVIRALAESISTLGDEVDELTEAIIERDSYIMRLEQTVEDLGLARDNVEIEGIQNTIAERKRGDRNPLTGLYNIEAFEREVTNRLTSVDPNGIDQHTGALFFVDLDHLAIWNEILNEQKVNDEILKPISKVILGQTRRNDIVGHWGGDEFAIFAPGITAEVAYEFAARVRDRINIIQTGTVPNGPQYVGVTTGFVIVESGDTYKEIMEQAAMAKRYAKDELNRNEIINYADIPDSYDFTELTKKARASLAKFRTAPEALSDPS